MSCILIWRTQEPVEITLNQNHYTPCYQKGSNFYKPLKTTFFHRGYEHRIVINSEAIQQAFSLSLSPLGIKKQGFNPVFDYFIKFM